MDQPLDFTKTKKSSSQNATKMFQIPHSENEESGRSSSSPSSTTTDRSTPEIFTNNGLNSFPKFENNQNLFNLPPLMPHVFNNVFNNSNIGRNHLNFGNDTLDALNNFMLNNKLNPFNNQQNFQQDIKLDQNRSQSNENLNKPNKSTRPKIKAVSRKSTIMAKHQQDEPMQSTSGFDSYSPNELSQQSNFSQFGLQESMNSSLNSSPNSTVNDVASCLSSNKRRRSQPVNESQKDDVYWLRRFKNNEAAKKSRDAKRAKDLETARRAAELEAKNNAVIQQVEQLKKENLILKRILIDFFGDNQIDSILANAKITEDELCSLAEQFRVYHQNKDKIDETNIMNLLK